MDEEISLISNQKDTLEQLKYPQPLTFQWRSIHVSLFLLGGISFFIASIAYLPSIINLAFGGWVFTIGSAGFAIADGLEWWTNNRVGCFHYENYKTHYEKTIGINYDNINTINGRLQRSEIGLNFFLSLLSSILYFVGSVLFIPSTNQSYNGTILFIVGSIFVFTAQSWKVIRASLTNPIKLNIKSFDINNLRVDLPGVLVDSFTGLGGLFYLIGSVLFLPVYYNDSLLDQWIAGVVFIIGGLFYSLAGLTMYYRYFYTTNYPH